MIFTLLLTVATASAQNPLRHVFVPNADLPFDAVELWQSETVVYGA